MDRQVVILDMERVKTGILIYLKEVHGIPMKSVRSIGVCNARVEFEEGVSVPPVFDRVPATIQAGGGI